MKVVFFTASVNIGGIERVFLSYASGLLKLGYEVHYVTCWEDGDLAINFPKGIQVHGLGNLRLRYSVFKLQKIFRKLEPDFVITGNDSTLVVFLAKLLSGNKRMKIITSQHSYYDNAETLFYTKYIIKYIYPKCDKIIAVSKGIADMLSLKFKLSQPKVLVLNNPIDLNSVTRNSNCIIEGIPQKYMLFVGRMTAVKNLFFLVDSFVGFHKCHEEFTLLMIGDGYTRKSLEQYVQNIGADSFIHFKGIQSNPYPFMKKASTLVLTSTSEAFPTVLIEAMALGVTCVSTPTKGAIDILEGGRLGYISSSFDNKEEFSELLKKSLSQAIDSDLLREEAKRLYSLDAKTNELDSIVKSL